MSSSPVPTLTCSLCGASGFASMEDGIEAEKNPDYVKRCFCGGMLLTQATDEEIRAMASSDSPSEAARDVERRIAQIMQAAGATRLAPRSTVDGGGGPPVVVTRRSLEMSPSTSPKLKPSGKGVVTLLSDALLDEAGGGRERVTRWIENLPIAHVRSLMTALSGMRGGGGLDELRRSAQGSSGSSSPNATAMQIRKQERAAHQAHAQALAQAQSTAPPWYPAAAPAAVFRSPSQAQAAQAAPAAFRAAFQSPPPPQGPPPQEVLQPRTPEGGMGMGGGGYAGVSRANVNQARYAALGRLDGDRPSAVAEINEYYSARNTMKDVKRALSGHEQAREFLSRPLPPAREAYLGHGVAFDLGTEARHAAPPSWTASVPDAPTPSSPAATALRRRKQMRNVSTEPIAEEASSPIATALRRRKQLRGVEAAPGMNLADPLEAMMARVDADIANFAVASPSMIRTSRPTSRTGSPLASSSSVSAPSSTQRRGRLNVNRHGSITMY